MTSLQRRNTCAVWAGPDGHRYAADTGIQSSFKSASRARSGHSSWSKPAEPFSITCRDPMVGSRQVCVCPVCERFPSCGSGICPSETPDLSQPGPATRGERANRNEDPPAGRPEGSRGCCKGVSPPWAGSVRYWECSSTPATTSGWAVCTISARMPPTKAVASPMISHETESGPSSPGSPR